MANAAAQGLYLDIPAYRCCTMQATSNGMPRVQSKLRVYRKRISKFVTRTMQDSSGDDRLLTIEITLDPLRVGVVV